MNEENELVMVYGSLKKGFGNHSLIQSSKLIGDVVTEEVFGMVSFGGFPGLLDPSYYQNSSHFRIQGELYEVTPETFARLDRLEGYPSFYNRKIITAKDIKDGEYYDCWIYYLNDNSSYVTRDDYINLKLINESFVNVWER